MSLRSVWPPRGKLLYWDPKDSWEDGRGYTFGLLDLQHPGQCLAEAFLNGKTNGHKIPFQYWHYTSPADTCSVISRILLGGNGRQSLLSFISFCVLRFFPPALFTEHTSAVLSLSEGDQERWGAKTLSLLSKSHIPDASCHLLWLRSKTADHVSWNTFSQE